MTDAPADNAAGTAGVGRPLAGRTIMVTRTREQAAALADPLEALGAEVVAFPVIAIADPDDWAPVDETIAYLSDYDWVIFTSANAVDRFLARVQEHGSDPADAFGPHGPRVAAVGSATAARLAEAGVDVALVPSGFRAEGLIGEFRRLASESGAVRSWRVLLPRALEAREVLPDTLRQMGHDVDVLPVYRTVAAEPDRCGLERLGAGTVDVITFTSGSTVRYFVDALNAAGLDPASLMSGLVVASIGPVTTAALTKRGFRADVEPRESTMPELVKALEDYFARARA